MKLRSWHFLIFVPLATSVLAGFYLREPRQQQPILPAHRPASVHALGLSAESTASFTRKRLPAAETAATESFAVPGGAAAVQEDESRLPSAVSDRRSTGSNRRSLPQAYPARLKQPDRSSAGATQGISTASRSQTTNRTSDAARSDRDDDGLGAVLAEVFSQSRRLMQGVRRSGGGEAVRELPPATVEKQYCRQLEAPAGITAVRWTVAAGLLPAGLALNRTTGMLCGTPTRIEIRLFTVSVTSSSGFSELLRFRLVVSEEDEEQEGELAILSTTLDAATVGVEYGFQLRGAGGSAPRRWSAVGLPSGISLDPASGVLFGTAENEGRYNISFTLRDKDGAAVTRALELEVKTSPLSITTAELRDAIVGVEYGVRLSAQGGAPPYRWQIVGGSLPEGIAFDAATGAFSGTPREAKSHLLRVRVLDKADASDSAELNLLVRTSELKIATTSLPEGAAGREYFAAFAAEGGSPPYRWSLISGRLPAGVSLQHDGVLTGTPEAAARADIRIAVRDSDDAQVESPFTLEISESPLVIVSTAVSSLRMCVAASEQLRAEGGAPPYHWQLVGGALPPELTLSAGGQIAGTPLDDFLESITVAVTDRAGSRVEGSLSVSVSGEALEIIAEALPAAVIDETYSAQLAARGGCPEYQWRVGGGRLPPGIGLSARGLISGTPSEAGSFSFSAFVRDSRGLETAADFAIEVPGEPLRIASTLSASAEAGLPFQFSLSAEGGQPPYVWSIAAGGLPSGLALNAASGSISGEPTAAGAFNATVVVTDRAGVQTEGVLFVSVAAAASPPEQTPGQTPNLPGGSGNDNGGDGSGGNDSPEGFFIAQASDGKVGLAWRLGREADIVEIAIFRSIDAASAGPDTGELIYRGRADNGLDTGLTNGETYYYSLFVQYRDGFADEPLQASATPTAVSLTAKPDPYLDEVVSYAPLDPASAFGKNALPGIVLGPPQGAGEFANSLDTVSLHARVNDDGGKSARYGGSIVVRFSDNIVINGPGPDFIVFENGFRLPGSDSYWIEPAVVEVSADGVNYYRFPFDFVPHYHDDGSLNLNNPFAYAKGFAGVRPVYSAGGSPDPRNPSLAGGDPFDLSDLPGMPLTWIQYIRLTATGDGWLRDVNGDLVRHSHEPPSFAASGVGNSGFDLDAATAIHY